MNEAIETELRQVPAETVAFEAVRGSYLNGGELIARVRSWAVTMGCLREGPMDLVFIDEPGEPGSSVDAGQEHNFEVWVPVQDGARTTPDDPVQVKHVPALSGLVRTIRGGYDPLQIPELYHATAEWLTAHGHSRNGAARWRYLDDPVHASAEGRPVEMELIFPVVASASAPSPS